MEAAILAEVKKNAARGVCYKELSDTLGKDRATISKYVRGLAAAEKVRVEKRATMHLVFPMGSGGRS